MRSKDLVRGISQVSALAMAAMIAAQPVLAQDSSGTPQPASPASTATDTGQATGLTEIVVTARRVEERLQDVPLSITAFNTQSLRDNKITQVADLGAKVPNLSIGRTSVAGASSISIRGVAGQGLPRVGLDTRVGVYLDGVYLARTQGSSFQLADIERIEILKGPQGTLFGRNVTAGSINLITAAPTGKFGAIVEGTIGTIDRRRGRITVNTPEYHGFSARFTYAHDQSGGDIKNLAAGYQPGPINVTVSPSAIPAGFPTGGTPFVFNYLPRKAAKSFGGTNSESYFAALRYDGIDGLVIDYKYDRTNELETNSAQNTQGYTAAGGCVAAAISLGASINQCGVGTIAFNNGVISAAPTGVTNSGGIDGVFQFTGPQTFSLGFQRPTAKAEQFTAPAEINSQGHNLTINYTASDNLALRSITGYRRLNTLLQQNVDGGSFSLLNTFLNFADPVRYPLSLYPAGGSTPYAIGMGFQGSKQSQWSQELQLIGKATPWLDYLLGGYLFREKGMAFQFTTLNSASSVANLLTSIRGLGTSPNFFYPPQKGLPPFTPNGAPNLWGLGALLPGDFTNVTSSSQAIFGRLTIRPVEELDIVLGGRYTRDHKTSRQKEFLAALLATPTLPRPPYLEQTFHKFTYDATATYHITPDVNVYGRYATAYLAGGQVRNAPFNPETTKSGEVGFKSEFFDRKVRFNAAAFYQKSKNFQLVSVAVLNVAGGIGVVTATGLANFSSQRVKGFEAELTAVPLTGLTLNGSVGYTSQKFSPIVTGSTGGLLVTLPIYRPAPNWTIQLGGQYDTPPVFDDAYLSLRLDADYRGKYAGAQPNQPSTGVLPDQLLNLYGLPTGNATERASSLAAYAAIYNRNILAGDFWLANARLSLANVRYGGAKMRISGYVKNAFNNKTGATFTTTFGYSGGANYVRKREYGVDLLLEF